VREIQQSRGERFYYRVTLQELDVIGALKRARYYEKFISEARNELRETPVKLHITSNRMLLEFELPFSKELTIENLLMFARNFTVWILAGSTSRIW